MVPTAKGSGVRETVYLWSESLFHDFSPLFFAAAAFSPHRYFFFYCRHEHDITSTELLWSTHWFHCIMMINGDPNTASCFFSLCATGEISFPQLYTHSFISKTAPHSPMCVIPIQNARILSFFFFSLLLL